MYAVAFVGGKLGTQGRGSAGIYVGSSDAPVARFAAHCDGTGGVKIINAALAQGLTLKLIAVWQPESWWVADNVTAERRFKNNGHYAAQVARLDRDGRNLLSQFAERPLAMAVQS